MKFSWLWFAVHVAVQVKGSFLCKHFNTVRWVMGSCSAQYIMHSISGHLVPPCKGVGVFVLILTPFTLPTSAPYSTIQHKYHTSCACPRLHCVAVYVFAHCVDRDGKGGWAATNQTLWGQRFVADVTESKKKSLEWHAPCSPEGTLDLKRLIVSRTLLTFSVFFEEHRKVSQASA